MLVVCQNGILADKKTTDAIIEPPKLEMEMSINGFKFTACKFQKVIERLAWSFVHHDDRMNGSLYC